jgi:hypothetical protein
MKTSIATLILLTGAAHASRPRDPGEPLPHVWTAGLRAELGDTADSFELSGRYEVGEATTGNVMAFGLEAVGGSLGGTGHLGFGGTGWIAPMGIGVGARVHALMAFDETMTGTRDLRPIARASLGVRVGWIEVGYSFQQPLGGERESWLAKHAVFVGINTPIGRDL